MSSALPPPRIAGVSELLEAATSLFKLSLPKCLPLAMAAVLAAAINSLYLRATGGTGGTLGAKPPTDPMYYVLELIGMLIYLLLAAALVVRLQALREGRITTVRENLASARPRWLTLLVAYLAAALLIIAGLVLLVLPGIYLAVCMALLVPVVVLESLTPMAAVKRSIQLVRPIWVKVFACLLIALLIMFVCLFTVGLISNMLLLLVGGNSGLSAALSSAVLMAAIAAGQLFLISLSVTIYSAASSSA